MVMVFGANFAKISIMQNIYIVAVNIDCMLYLIKSVDYVKVGYANDVEKRMKSYKTENPNFELISIRNGNPVHEKMWHDFMFNNLELRKSDTSKEWFFCNDKRKLKILETHFKAPHGLECSLPINSFIYCSDGLSKSDFPEESPIDVIVFDDYGISVELQDNGLYIISKTGNCMKTNSVNVKTFYRDYDDDFDGTQMMHGFIIDNTFVVYETRMRGSITFSCCNYFFEDFETISKKDISNAKGLSFGDKVYPFIENFTFTK